MEGFSSHKYVQFLVTRLLFLGFCALWVDGRMGEVHTSSQSLLAGNLGIVENTELALQMYTAQWDRLNSPHYHTNHTTDYKGFGSENVVCLAL